MLVQSVRESGVLGAIKCQARCGEGEMAFVEHQKLFWRGCLASSTRFWCCKWRKEYFFHPDFRHNDLREALRLSNRQRPAWVQAQLPKWANRLQGPVETLSTSSGECSDLEIRMCTKLCESGPILEALDALDLLVQRGCSLSHNLFYLVLKRCIAQKDSVLGNRVHLLATKSGYDGHVFLATHLIGMYASCGKLNEAVQVFDKVSAPDAYNWSAIISACAKHGEPKQAILLYRKMRRSTVQPNNYIFSAVLRACACAGDLAAGKDVHGHVLTSSDKPDIFVQTCLVDMYAKCGSIEDARKVFDLLPHKNVVTWTAMISGYAQQGMGQRALNLYSSMQKEGIGLPNSVTFVCLLQACAAEGDLALPLGKRLHAQIHERGFQIDVVLGASLVNMYAKCGSIQDARRVFNKLRHRDLVTWNGMIAAYAQQGMGEKALSLYCDMQREGLTPPGSMTFSCLLQACARMGLSALHHGKQLHAQIAERRLQDDVVVGGSLVNMYAKCGTIQDARRVFDRLRHKNVVAWNAMIAGYTQQGKGFKALALYSSMRRESINLPDSATYACLLQACSSLGAVALNQGKKLHAEIEERELKNNLIIANSLVTMYAKCGNIEDARVEFDRLPHRDVVTWTAMIAGYAYHEMGQEALGLYSSMQQEGIIPPDSVTFVCLLQACATEVALPLGKQLHAQIEQCGWQADTEVSNALVNMYAKCGSMVDAQRVFDALPKREIAAWGALSAGYTRQGDGEVVFQLLDRMRQEGIQPDGVTFLSLLTVCSHAGLVDKGKMYFKGMTTDYSISPTIEHYTCLMDLLGRAGHIDEALGMAKTMPFPRNDASCAAVWISLLGACQKWNCVEIGRQAFEFAVRLDETDATSYVLMSNIYESAAMWEEAREMQARRLKSRAWKQPGESWWTDSDGALHRFGVEE